jgi:hypothetical protein
MSLLRCLMNEPHRVSEAQNTRVHGIFLGEESYCLRWREGEDLNDLFAVRRV